MNTITLLLVSVSVISASPALQDYVSGNNNFAASVYKELSAKSEDNLLVSPLSAHLILSLSQNGAGYDTAEEIQHALKIPHCKSTVNEGVATLLQKLKQDPNYVLQIINKIYVKKGYQMRDDFNSTAHQVFDSSIEDLDFSCKYQAAKVINEWVENETNHKITELIDPETLGNKTRAVLINALRFRANWTTPFHYYATVKKDFYSYDSVVTLDTLHMYDEEFTFYENTRLNATFLELPLEGNASMVIALPNHIDGLPVLEANIDEVLEAPESTSRDLFNVALPKFKLESRIDFKDVLQNLGVKKAFQEGVADFTQIAGLRGELYISDVVQKCFLEVDRNGIEGAAATYVVKIVNRIGGDAREFNANHPFIFFVKVDDVIVFLGRVVLP